MSERERERRKEVCVVKSVRDRDMRRELWRGCDLHVCEWESMLGRTQERKSVRVCCRERERERER